MELLSLISGFNIAGMGTGTIASVATGMLIAWCIPQPAFVQPLTEMICRKFNLSRFHQKGHQHSDEHVDNIITGQKESDHHDH